MGFIDNDHVPPGAGDFLAAILIPSGVCGRGQDEVLDRPWVLRWMLVAQPPDRVAVVEGEAEVELGLELLLPLANEARGYEDQDPRSYPAGLQLADQQPRFDRLPQPDLVGEDEPVRVALSDAVNYANLMGLNLNPRVSERG